MTNQSPREIDAEVAEKMGWILADRKKAGWCDGPPVYYTNLPDIRTWQDFSPSTRIADAFVVVKEMTKRGYVAGMNSIHGTNQWCCHFNNYDEIADTLPMAICLAALAAIEKEKR